MFSDASPLGRLLAAPMRPGTVVWIGLRPERRAAMQAVTCADLDVQDGLIGDHYAGRASRSRQVTLIAAESLAAIGSFLGVGAVAAERLRRNVVVAGVNPHALKGQSLRIGSAVLAVTGECHPCSRMEEELGVGGYNALRGHGGITARVIRSGRVCLGDAVVRAAADDAPQ